MSIDKFGHVGSDKRSDKRIVEFNNTEEKSPIVKMMYRKYLEETAQRKRLIIKRGRMVDPGTKKVSDGNLCEESILGRCNIKMWEMIPVPAKKARLDRITKEKAKKYLFAFVRKRQPKSNQDRMNLISNIERFIQQKIEPVAEENNQKIKQVKVYSAIGSPLDFQYGVDGWIEIENNDGYIEKITFDLKTGNSKIAEYNTEADIILNINIDSRKIKLLPRESLIQMFNLGKEITKAYRDRLKNRV